MPFEIAKLALLIPHPDFARLFEPLSEKQHQQLRQDMAGGQHFPPLLIDSQRRILAGVEHWRAALALGWRRMSVVRAPDLGRSEVVALIVAENMATNDMREQHLSRTMNNFFDMLPLRPQDGW